MECLYFRFDGGFRLVIDAVQCIETRRSCTYCKLGDIGGRVTRLQSNTFCVRYFFHKVVEGVVTIPSGGEVVRYHKVYIVALIVSIQTLSNMRWLTPI